MSKDYTICFTEDELKINPKVDTNGLQFICSKINNEQFESFRFEVVFFYSTTLV